MKSWSIGAIGLALSVQAEAFDADTVNGRCWEEYRVAYVVAQSLARQQQPSIAANSAEEQALLHRIMEFVKAHPAAPAEVAVAARERCLQVNGVLPPAEPERRADSHPCQSALVDAQTIAFYKEQGMGVVELKALAETVDDEAYKAVILGMIDEAYAKEDLIEWMREVYARCSAG